MLGDLQGGDQHQQQGDDDLFEGWRQRVAAQVGGDGHRHDDLQKFRGLELDEAQIQPALCPLADVAEHHDTQQQHDADREGRRRPAGVEGRGKLGHEDHQTKGHPGANQLAAQHLGMHAGGGVEHHQADAQQGQQAEQQWQVDVEALPE